MGETLTKDTFFDGLLGVNQSRDGYRFSIDSVLLAWHSRPAVGDIVLDLGTGCGIIPMILALRYPEIIVHGVEIQETLGRLAKENIDRNNLQGRIQIHLLDMLDLTFKMVSAPVDLIVTNPPYRRIHSGRVNPDNQRAVARHEIKINLADLIGTAKRLLRTAGRFMAIYPAERLVDMLNQLRICGLEPKYIRMIHSRAADAAKLFLVEATKGGRPGMKIDRNLVIYQPDGNYTDEVANMFLL
jgi:tRNA1Val (adenine37-N6)-methyltransferase